MKLSDYFAQEGITAAEFGRRIGMSRSAVGRLLTGERQPSWPVMQRIIEATKGTVQPNDFHNFDIDGPPSDTEPPAAPICASGA